MNLASYVLLYRAMACPYFFPTARLDNGSWVIPPRVPLGDAQTGECRANAIPFQPDEAHLRDACNCGYGRLGCERFPADAACDAVRFHVGEESGALIRIQYVFEKDSWPAGHGMLDYSLAAREIRGTEDAILARQAEAFVESYVRRKDQALATGA